MALVFEKKPKSTATIEFDPGDGSDVERYVIRRISPMKALHIDKKYPDDDDPDKLEEILRYMIVEWDAVDADGNPVPVDAEHVRAMISEMRDSNAVMVERVNFLLQKQFDPATWGDVDVEGVKKKRARSRSGERETVSHASSA